MKYQDLTSLIKTPIFSKNDIVLAGGKIFNYQLTRWVKKDLINKWKIWTKSHKLLLLPTGHRAIMFVKHYV